MGAWLVALAAGGFWTGILLAGGWWHRPAGGWAAVVLCVGAGSLLRLALRGSAATTTRRSGLPGILFGFALLGAGWGGLRQYHTDSSPLAALAETRAFVHVVGRLASGPDEGSYGWTAVLDSRTVVSPGSEGGFAVRDPIWLEGDGPPPAARTGDVLSVEGVLTVPSGGFGKYLRLRGYPAAMSVDSIRVVARSSNPLVRASDGLRGALARSLAGVFRPLEAALVMGLALGDTSRLDPLVVEDFRATGLTHLTAVSGANVAMFLAPILAVTAALRLGRRARFAVGISALAFFVLLTRAEPSVLRAAAMSGLAMLGIFLGRPRSPPAILGGAVLALLLASPELVYAIGFQLSVAATVGMAVLAQPLADRLRLVPRALALALSTTTSAQAGVMPILLYHFGLVPTVTIPANVLAFPAVAPAMLLGLLAAGLAMVSPALGRPVAWLASLPLRYLEEVADRLARAPLPAVTSRGGSVLVLIAGFAVVAGLAWWLRSGRRLPRRAAIVALVALALFVWHGAIRAGPPASLAITFFDVGQGDAALVRSPGGATILIDGGPDDDEVARKLAALGVHRIDIVVASHPHADHVAGLPVVLARFAVGLVLDPGCEGDSPFYAEFLKAVRDAGVPFRHPGPGTALAVADVRIDILGPDRCYTGTESDANNDSLVLRLSKGSASILFPGDAEEPSQTELVEDWASALPAVVLKVPHHGGATSLPEFFAAVHSGLAVVSVGPNRYGHPVPSLLALLQSYGMRVVRTDLVGDVVVRWRGSQVFVEGIRI